MGRISKYRCGLEEWKCERAGKDLDTGRVGGRFGRVGVAWGAGMDERGGIMNVLLG